MKNINFNSCVIADNKIWFISVQGYFMNYDYTKNVTHIVVPQNLAELEFKSVTDTMILNDKRIYFLEQDGKKLYEYDIATNYCHYYNMPKFEMSNWGCFAGIYLWNNKIYIFGKNAGRIYYFDTNTKDFMNVSNDNVRRVTCSARVNDKVYLANGDRVLSYSLSNEKYEEVYKFDNEVITWMRGRGNGIDILTQKDNVIEFDAGMNRKIPIYTPQNSSKMYVRACITNNKLFLLPNGLGSERVCVVEKETGNVNFAEQPEDLIYREIGWSKYSGYCEDQDKVWFANRVSNYFLSIEKKSGKVKWVKIPSPSLEDISLYLKKSNNRIIKEEEVELKQFLSLLMYEK